MGIQTYSCRHGLTPAKKHKLTFYLNICTSPLPFSWTLSGFLTHRLTPSLVSTTAPQICRRQFLFICWRRPISIHLPHISPLPTFLAHLPVVKSFPSSFLGTENLPVLSVAPLLLPVINGTPLIPKSRNNGRVPMNSSLTDIFIVSSSVSIILRGISRPCILLSSNLVEGGSTLLL
jgi:hypothetical protein